MTDAASDVSALVAHAQELMSAGKPAEAADAFGEIVERLESANSPDIHLRADAMRLRGSALRDAGRLDESTNANEAAVALLEQSEHNSTNDITLAIALRSLVVNYLRTGNETGAADRHQRCLAVVDRFIGDATDRAADIVFALASDLHAAGRSDWTSPIDWLAKRADSLDDGHALFALARVDDYWDSRNDDARSMAAIERAGKRLLSLDDVQLAAVDTLAHNFVGRARMRAPELARAVYDRAMHAPRPSSDEKDWLWRRMGVLLAQDIPPAERVEQFRDLDTRARSIFPPEDERRRIAQRELADALLAAGQSAAAIDAYREVVSAALAASAHVEAAGVAAELGHALDQLQRFGEAIDAHRQAYLIRTRVLGPNDEATMRSCYEVAELSRVLSRFDEAEFYFLRVIDILAARRETTSEISALAHNNLGEVYGRVGRYEDAQHKLEQGLAIRVAVGGENGEQTWRSRSAIAQLALVRGDPATAVAMANEGLERAGDGFASTFYVILAGGLLGTGDLAGAERIYQAMFDQIPVSEAGRSVMLHVYLAILDGLTRCRMARSEWHGAAECAARVLDVARMVLPRLVQDAAEAEVVHTLRPILELQSLWLDALRRASITDGAEVARAFDLAQLTKGFRTRYVRLRQPGVGNVDAILQPDEDSEIAATLQKIRELTNELTQLYLTLNDRRAFETSRVAGAKRAHLRSLERELANRVGDIETQFDLAPLGGSSLLPDGAAGIEIMLVTDIPAEREGRTPAHRYMAFALAPGDGTKPRLFDLGLVVELDAAVAEMRSSLVDGIESATPAWQRLSRFLGRRVLGACWSELQSAAHVVIGPDGAFSTIPFELLTTPNGKYLLDEVHVSYCMRLAELAHRSEMFRRGDPPIVIAGPDFDLPRAFSGRRQHWNGSSRVLRTALGAAGEFESLDGAREEGRVVADLLGVAALTSEWGLATELTANGSPEIIHIATHGFVLPREGVENEPLSLAAPVGNALDRRMVLDDSLQRSGLAFAGINAILAGQTLHEAAGEGVIYAAEIQQLDLQRTDLVVLGACRSGLGEIAAADGAHGLRRAFLAAGCRSVVSALWDVPDDSSRTLLAAFYMEILAGKSRLDALKRARTVVRDQHPDDPLYWAAFVLDGCTGPLGRFSPLSDLKVATLSARAWGIHSAADTDAMARVAEQIKRGAKSRVGTTVAWARRSLADSSLGEAERNGVLAWHANLANRLGDNERAIQDYRTLLAAPSLTPAERAGLLYNIAKIHQQSGELDLAVAGYTEVIDSGGDDRARAMSRVNRGIVLLELQMPEASRADTEAVIADPTSPPDQVRLAHVNRADILRDTAPGVALESIDVALAMVGVEEGDDLRLRAFRVELLVKVGRVEDARREAAELLGNSQLTDELRTHLAAWSRVENGA